MWIFEGYICQNARSTDVCWTGQCHWMIDPYPWIWPSPTSSSDIRAWSRWDCNWVPLSHVPWGHVKAVNDDSNVWISDRDAACLSHSYIVMRNMRNLHEIVSWFRIIRFIRREANKVGSQSLPRSISHQYWWVVKRNTTQNRGPSRFKRHSKRNQHEWLRQEYFLCNIW